MTEYLVVSDMNGAILMSSEDRYACLKFANKVRKAGGAVTIFKSTKL